MPTTEMTNVWENPTFYMIVSVLALTMSFVFVALGIYRRRSTRATTSSESVQAARAPDVLRCASGCGEPATEPSPSLTRSRDDVLRRYFGAPPRYKRTVDRMGIPVYCLSHAHVADARLDKWIYDVRARTSTHNSSIAGEAARVVMELPAQVAEELSEEQRNAAKAASKRMSNVRSIVANGS